MTLDELLKLHPLPWRIVEDWPGFNVHDADGLPVDDTRPEAQAVCDAMSELVRLREEAEHCHGAKESEKGELEIRAKTIAELRARNAELEASELAARNMAAMLRRIRKYSREDGMVTPGSTRLSRAIEQAEGLVFRLGYSDSALLGDGGAL